MIPSRKVSKCNAKKPRPKQTPYIGRVFHNMEIIGVAIPSKFPQFAEYNVKCLDCGKMSIRTYRNMKSPKHGKCKCKHIYTKEHFNNLSVSSAKAHIDKTNTTGYKGVCPYVIYKSQHLKGYQAVLFHRKHRIMRNIITLDDTNGDKLQAILICAIDRDIFIREKELPHFRNFTDDKLKELIEEDFYLQIKKDK